jgi:hypothetical protein
LRGEILRFDKTFYNLNLDSTVAASLNIIADVIRTGSVKVESVIFSVAQYNSSVPIGGILKFGSELFNNVKLKNALKDCLPNIIQDLACFYFPQLGIIRLCIHGIGTAKELITRRGTMHIGPFDVRTSTRISLRGFFKHGIRRKYTLELPYLHINVTEHSKHTEDAKQKAIVEFEKQARQRCYARMGRDYDDLKPDESTDKTDDSSGFKSS